MRPSRAYKWLIQNRNRNRVLCTLTQPLTASRLARRLDINASTCMSILADLREAGVCICLNPQANKSRLYGLTPVGHRFQSQVRREFGLAPVARCSACIDWGLYGFSCFSHHAAIVSVLTQPRTAAEIKRQIRKRDPEVRTSCNNIRDALRAPHQKGMVQKLTEGSDNRPRYVLTDSCAAFPDMLNNARWSCEERLDRRAD